MHFVTNDIGNSTGASPEEPNTLSALWMAIVTVTGLLIDAFIIFGLPYVAKKLGRHSDEQGGAANRVSSSFAMSIANSFAGGLFVVIGLMHILEGGRKHLAKSEWGDETAKWSMAEALAFIGYCLMLGLQRVVLAGYSNKSSNSGSTTNDDETIVNSPHYPENNGHKLNSDGGVTSTQTPMIHDSAVTVVSAIDDDEKADKRQEYLSLMALFAMFAVHGVIAGVVLGLQQTQRNGIIMFAAIMGHHWGGDMIFSLATGEPRGLRGRKLLRFALAAALTCNVAVGVGIASMISNASFKVIGVMLSLTAGTFLFFGFTDVVPTTIPKDGQRYSYQMLAFVAGATLIYIFIHLLPAP